MPTIVAVIITAVVVAVIVAVVTHLVTKSHIQKVSDEKIGSAEERARTIIDDAVKATNTEVLSIEFPRDTKGWGGHGNYIVIGGNDVSDASPDGLCG